MIALAIILVGLAAVAAAWDVANKWVAGQLRIGEAASVNGELRAELTALTERVAKSEQATRDVKNRVAGAEILSGQRRGFAQGRAVKIG